MSSLIYKDFKLSINWFFYIIMPVIMGALLLIPQWPYLIAFMYFFFITVPNVFNTFNAQNDFGFAVMMPVTKKEIVKGKIFTFIVIELLHLAAGAVFAFVHIKLYGFNNFMLNPGFAFFGIAFAMYAVFNIVFFPIYFGTAYRFGFPTIAATTAAVLFAAFVEITCLKNSQFKYYLEGRSPEMIKLQIAVLAGGVVVFFLSGFISYKISAKRFEKIDL